MTNEVNAVNAADWTSAPSFEEVLERDHKARRHVEFNKHCWDCHVEATKDAIYYNPEAERDA